MLRLFACVNASIFLASLMALSACGPTTSSENQTTNDEQTSATSAEASTPEGACPPSSEYICEDGLAFARLTGYIADVYLSDLPEDASRDSVESGNGYVWLSRTLHLAEGRLVLEGDFIDDRSNGLDTLLSDSRISRIRIESPEFKTMNGIQVGNTLGDLMNAFSEMPLTVFSIADYETLEISSPESRIYYLLRDPANAIAEAAGETLSLEAIPAETQIYALVVR